MAKGTQVRIKPHVLRMVRAIAGRLQIETGESISDNDAILHVIKELYPDIAARFPDDNGEDAPAQESA